MARHLKKRATKSDKTSDDNEKYTQLFLIPFVIIGIATFVYAGYQCWNVYRAQDWQAVEAELLDLDLASTIDDGVTMYKVNVTYQYDFNGAIHQNNLLAFGYQSSNIERHKEIFSKLEAAKKIEVFVNNYDASEAIIYPGFNDSITFVLCFSLIWNSGISLFLFPMLNIKIKGGWHLTGAVLIWILSLVLMFSGIFDIEIHEAIRIVQLASG